MDSANDANDTGLSLQHDKPNVNALDTGNLPPELRDVIQVARSSLPKLHSCTDTQILSLQRLDSADHNLVKVKPRSHNPIVWFIKWWMSWAVPGMGMFSEAYIVFSIGNITPLLAITYPNCFGKGQPSDCNQSARQNDTTVEICGIICGMLVLGFMADWIGRKWGSRITMVFMLVGGIILSASAGNAETFLIVFLIGLFIFGFGVGGEYPMASSSAAERAEGNPEMRKRRGEVVVLTFTQQGWGNWANTLVILILLAIMGATSTVSAFQAEWAWRAQFIIGTVIIAAVSVYRMLYLEESEVWAAERKGVDHELEIEGEAEHPAKLYSVIFKRYSSRLFITSFAWVLNDLAFYGNKLFQSTFITAISGPDTPIFKRMQWTLLNSTVSLAGYFTAALLIDKQWYGRLRMQTMGFFMMFVLFLPCGIAYDSLVSNYIKVFQFLYFFSSYWNQFGPNCTTWLVAGEVFPTDVRAFFHGISAAFGKAGAIAATQIFSRLSTQNTFYISAGAGIAGAISTIIFLPDTTGLDLGEIDRFNMYLLAGQSHLYHGEAVNPKYLSLFERWVGWGKTYDPERDAEQKKLQQLNKALQTVEEEENGEGEGSGVDGK